MLTFPFLGLTINIQESDNYNDNNNEPDQETQLKVREGFFSGYLYAGLDALSIKVFRETTSFKRYQ